MLGAAYGTVADIEIVWTLIALIGIGFGIFNLRDARGDKRFLVENDIFNGRRIIASYAVRAEAARVIIQSLFALSGFLAMFLPEMPPAKSITLTVIISAVIRWSFIISGLVLLFKSVDAYITRHRLTGDSRR